MTDFTSEEQCELCSGMWASERGAFRATLETLPLDKPVCNACLMAFWHNVGFPISTDEEPKH
jgi:hypothetical protein